MLSRLPGRCDAIAPDGPLAGVPLVAWIAHRSVPSHWGAMSGPSLTVDASALHWPRDHVVKAVAQALARLLGSADAPTPEAPLVRLVVTDSPGSAPDEAQHRALVDALVGLLARAEPVPPGPRR